MKMICLLVSWVGRRFRVAYYFHYQGEAVTTSETSANSARLHDARYLKTGIFLLADMS
jgi:hypothetical protein